ncbi:MAG: hypothetical protein Q7R67_02185 [bacterium]|nr:hypothetical protein [bacterium]
MDQSINKNKIVRATIVRWMLFGILLSPFVSGLYPDSVQDVLLSAYDTLIPLFINLIVAVTLMGIVGYFVGKRKAEKYIGDPNSGIIESHKINWKLIPVILLMVLLVSSSYALYGLVKSEPICEGMACLGAGIFLLFWAIVGGMLAIFVAFLLGKFSPSLSYRGPETLIIIFLVSFLLTPLPLIYKDRVLRDRASERYRKEYGYITEDGLWRSPLGWAIKIPAGWSFGWTENSIKLSQSRSGVELPQMPGEKFFYKMEIVFENGTKRIANQGYANILTGEYVITDEESIKNTPEYILAQQVFESAIY